MIVFIFVYIDEDCRHNILRPKYSLNNKNIFKMHTELQMPKDVYLTKLSTSNSSLTKRGGKNLEGLGHFDLIVPLCLITR